LKHFKPIIKQNNLQLIQVLQINVSVKKVMVKLSANFCIMKGEIIKIKSPHTYNSPTLRATYLNTHPNYAVHFKMYNK